MPAAYLVFAGIAAAIVLEIAWMIYAVRRRHARSAETSHRDLIGQTATVMTAFIPVEDGRMEGTVALHRELWIASWTGSRESRPELGQPVRIISVEGSKLLVLKE